MKHCMFATCLLAVLQLNLFAQDQQPAADSTSFALTPVQEQSDTPAAVTDSSTTTPAPTAQESAKICFVFLKTGYGLGLGGLQLPSTVYISSTGALTKKTDNYLNYGQGLRVSAGAEYLLFDKVYARCGLEYIWGVPPVIVDTVRTSASVPSTYRTSCFGISAAIAPRFMVLDLFDMYISAGFGLYLTSLSIEESGNPIKGTYETTPALAFNTAVGIDYPLTADLIAFGEIAYDIMSFSITKITSNSTALNYKANSIITNEYTPFNIPGSNIGLKVGIRYGIF